VAHEINTPIGIGITASSLITQEIKELKSLLISENLSQSKLEQFLDIIEESSDLTTRNLQRVGNLVSDFKEVAVNQRSMKKRQTRINHTIQNACIMLAPTLAE
jgi:signal transduction histidine kinase